jgi:hypothetical protein
LVLTSAGVAAGDRIWTRADARAGSPAGSILIVPGAITDDQDSGAPPPGF